jgi:hypothetical protein
MNNLFEKGKSIHTEQRAPDRPFEALSSYVVETMPMVLDDIRKGHTHVDELIKGAEARVPFFRMSVFANPKARDLAGLDAKMLEAAIVHSGGTPKRGLATLVDDLSRATGMKAGITYEDLIFINPLKSDPRLFTTGEAGRAERDFYLGHRLLEDPLRQAVQKCKDASEVLQVRGKQGIVKAGTLLHEAQRLFIPVTSYTSQIGQNMSKESFKIFRQYLGGNTDRNIVGPSGKFTAGIPTLDFLLGGLAIVAEYPKLEEEMGYYPRAGQKEIQMARAKAQSGQSLIDLSRAFGNPKELFGPLQTMSSAIREFRGAHMKAVRHQVPEALANTATGTGGEDDAGTFLRKRLRIHHVPKVEEAK